MSYLLRPKVQGSTPAQEVKNIAFYGLNMCDDKDDNDMKSSRSGTFESKQMSEPGEHSKAHKGKEDKQELYCATKLSAVLGQEDQENPVAGTTELTNSQRKGEMVTSDSHTNESVVKLVQVLKFSQSDWNKMRQELELSFQAQMLAKEREWSHKVSDRDSRLAALEESSRKLQQTNDDMRGVVAEFEKTIAQLQSEKEKANNATQQSVQDVIKERDQALEDLQSVETAFSDLHRRYEKTKSAVEGFKQNEELLKKCVQDLQNKLKKTEQKLQVLKGQAEEKLQRATEEIERTQKSNASEMAKLEAALKKAELQVQSMENTLEQKVKENKELAAICDELIAKVQ